MTFIFPGLSSSLEIQNFEGGPKNLLESGGVQETEGHVCELIDRSLYVDYFSSFLHANVVTIKVNT